MRRITILAFASAVAVACSSADDGTIGPRTTQDVDAGSTEADASPSPKADAATTADAGQDAGPGYTGEATYYAADGTGACGFPASPNDLMVAAMNKAQYAKSLCGQCVSVVGPSGTVKVRIVDLCPGCAKGDLDLSEQAFAKIAKLSAGRVKITWTFVPC